MTRRIDRVHEERARVRAEAGQGVLADRPVFRNAEGVDLFDPAPTIRTVLGIPEGLAISFGESVTSKSRQQTSDLQQDPTEASDAPRS